MKPKSKKLPPEVGCRVRLRGRHKEGVLAAVGKQPTWAAVVWDGGENDGPKWCHIDELERIES